MFRISLVVFASLAMACSSQNKTTSATAKNYTKDSLLVAIERNACFGKCPEYKASIYKSGYAEYYGRRNVVKTGYYVSRLSSDQMDKLYGFIRSYNIESKDTSYVNKNLADYPSWSLWISDLQPTKHIFISHQAPPVEVKQFGLATDQILDSLNWTKKASKNDE